MTKTQYLAALKTNSADMDYTNIPETPVDAAWERFHNGEITLTHMGDILLDSGMHPYQVRQILSAHTHYSIPENYFGREE